VDPIHPIVPTTPRGITPVAPAPAVTPAERQAQQRRRRQDAEREQRQNKRQDSYQEQGSHPSVDDDAGEDDGRLHIDVIA
jgi:hypothetical protein